MITGASEGIGKTFAMELAKRKFNVVVMSRTQSKLEEVKKEIESKVPGVQVKVLAVDFSDTTVYSRVEEFLNKQCAPVSVLVNNVGMNFSFPTPYLDSSTAESMRLVNCNIVAVNEMTRICLPGMVERKAGVIINMSSFTGVIPTPLLSTYSATKAYVHFFSECLNTEYSRKGVVVQCLVPALVESSMSKMRRSLLVADPREIVTLSLAHLGRVVTYCPNLVHALMEWVMTRESLGSYIQSMVYNQNSGIRAAALRKQQRQNKQN